MLGLSDGCCVDREHGCRVDREPEEQSFHLKKPEVTTATVDFDKATAFVWTTPEAKATKDWQKQLAEKLANHLTTCGFQSQLHEEAEAEES